MTKNKIKCTHCGHVWKTVSETVLVTCAGCGLKVKNPHRKANPNFK